LASKGLHAASKGLLAIPFLYGVQKYPKEDTAMQTNQNNQITRNTSLPETGFLRLPQVLAVYPVSKSTWWQMIREDKAPKPVKLSRRCAAWRVEDIRAMIEGR
jgi:prophage regulatory protein